MIVPYKFVILIFPLDISQLLVTLPIFHGKNQPFQDPFIYDSRLMICHSYHCFTPLWNGFFINCYFLNGKFCSDMTCWFCHLLDKLFLWAPIMSLACCLGPVENRQIILTFFQWVLYFAYERLMPNNQLFVQIFCHNFSFCVFLCCWRLHT